MIVGSGLYYRVMFADGGDPTASVGNPEGRFHHSGQAALYASATVEGAVVAALTYLSREDPPRQVHPLRLEGARLIDLRDPAGAARQGLDPAIAAGRWRDDRAAGRPAATWLLSDAARATGADGMLYASRKRPALSHLVLFAWNLPGAPHVSRAGAPLPFAPG